MDKWQSNGITLYLGDCLEVLPTLPAGSVDAVVTDPPYGTTACAWDTVIPFELMWEQLKRIAKPHAAIVLFGSQPFTSALIMSNVRMFKYEWIWEKSNGSNFASVKRQPLKVHENVLVFSNGSHSYNPQMTWDVHNRERDIKRKESYISAERGIYGQIKRTCTKLGRKRYPRSVQRFALSPRNNQFVSCYNHHPTEKPVALIEYLVRTYSNENNTVLDFTMGSGTTGIACVQTGRSFIGIEIDEGYFDIAKTRIEKAQQEMIQLSLERATE